MKNQQRKQAVSALVHALGKVTVITLGLPGGDRVENLRPASRKYVAIYK